MKYPHVIFDFDGTIADSSKGIFNSIRNVEKIYDFPNSTEEQMRSHIGPSVEKAYSRSYNISGDLLESVIQTHKEYMVSQGSIEITFYDGIIDTIMKLHNSGIRCSIATLKADAAIQKIINHFEMDGIIDYALGAEYGKGQTKTYILNNCISRSDISLESTVLIGDSHYDAVGATEASIDFLAVLYGFGFKNAEEANRYDNIGSVRMPKDILNKMMI